LINKENLIFYYDKKNKFSHEEIKNIYELIHKMELVNTRLNLISQIVQIIFDTQQNYFKTGENNSLNVLEEKQVAKLLDVDPGWVSRIIQQKNILTPWGEKELRFFFISKEKKKNKKACKVYVLYWSYINMKKYQTFGYQKNYCKIIILRSPGVQ